MTDCRCLKKACEGNYRTLRGLRTVNPEGLLSTRLCLVVCPLSTHIFCRTMTDCRSQKGNGLDLFLPILSRQNFKIWIKKACEGNYRTLRGLWTVNPEGLLSTRLCLVVCPLSTWQVMMLRWNHVATCVIHLFFIIFVIYLYFIYSILSIFLFHMYVCLCLCVCVCELMSNPAVFRSNSKYCNTSCWYASYYERSSLLTHWDR